MSDSYESFESLGAHHPIQVEVTVAQAEERERAGIPLPISGDPESEFTYQLLAIRKARFEREAAAAESLSLPNLRDSLNRHVQSEPGGRAVDTSENGPQMLELRASFSEGVHLHRIDVFFHVQSHLEEVRAEVTATEKTRDMRELLSVQHIAAGHNLSRISQALRRIDNAPPDVGDGERFHENSPSVGAPNSAVRDNSNPTEGDHPTHPSRSGIWPTLAHEPVPALAARPRVVIAGWIQGGPLPVAS